MKHAYAVAVGIAAFFSLNCGSGDEAPAASPSSGATSSSGGGAATAAATVTASGASFSPAEVRIKAGETVRWSFTGGSHNVVSGTGCSPDGKFTSGATKSSGSFDKTFDVAGTYEYYCDPHCGMGMKGTVIVE
jgi:plastocyanin